MEVLKKGINDLKII